MKHDSIEISAVLQAGKSKAWIAFLTYKTSEFSEKSPSSEAEKRHDYTVTLCYRFVSTDADFPKIGF